MTALLNMSELSSIELLLQNIDSLEGHHLHVVLEQQLVQYCHLENFKFKDVNGITRTMRTKRSVKCVSREFNTVASLTYPLSRKLA